MKKHNLTILFGTMMFIMLLSCQQTTKYIYIHDDNTSDTNNHGSTTSSTTVATVPSGNNNGKITKLQDIVDNAQPNGIIDCSQYKITDYNATVDKSLTIMNANMQGDTLNVTAEGVVLTNLAKVSVNTNASLKISGSLLSSLSVGNVTNGRGELIYPVAGRGDDQAVVVELEGDTVVRDAELDLANASIKTDSSADIENIEVRKNAAIKGNAANIRLAGSKIKLEVTDLSADNVTFVGNNTTLSVINKESSIKNVETDEDVICQLEMEDGPYANMSNPTVRGENGKLTRVDNTNESILSKITLELANLEKVAYSVGEVVNLNGLEIFDTYNRDGVVEFTQEFPQGVKVPTHTRRETAPLDNPEYSFSTNGANAVGYTFQESDRGQVDITITKTEGNISVSTVLKVTVLKDDELAISYVGAEAEQSADLPKVFKKSQNVVIPTNMTKTGFVFAGWYENNNIGPITGWEANTKESSVSLYARWINMLYVDPDVTNDTGTGAYNMPFKMIEQAIGAITSTGSYTIVLKKDIVSYGKISFKNNFPVNITIQPEEGSAYIKGYEYLMFEDNFEQTKNIALTMKNISFDGEIDASNSKSLTLENVNIGNNIRCGQASFTNVTATQSNVYCTNATFTDVTIDGCVQGTNVSFNNVIVNSFAYFEQGTLTNVKILGSVECNSAVFTDSEVSYVRCNGESTFKNVTIREGDLTAFADINLGGNLSFAGKIVLAVGKKIVLTDSITTSNPIVIEIPSGTQKFQIIDGRSDYVSADGNKFIIDGTAWYLKNGQLRRYWYVDGTNGDDNNLGSEDHPLKTVHKAVESARADSIIYVSADTSEDACMDIIYDTEIYPFGYVNDESWTGGHLVIQRNCFGDDYQKSFIKVHENAKLKARYFEFNGNSKLVSVPMSHAAGITVAGGYIDIKHCIISRFTSIFYEDNIYNWGGPGGLSLYNMNETEKTIILEDLTIDSCHGYTMALAVGNSCHDDGSLTVEIGKNVNIIGGFWDITRAARPSTEYLPTVIRLDGKSSKLTLTKDIKLNTYFEDNNLTYNRNYLIDISAGVFTIDNCTLSLPEKPNNYSHILVNGIYAHSLRPGVHPKLKFRGSNQSNPRYNYDSNAKIYSYDDVAITLEGQGAELTYCDSMENDYLNIISKNPGHGTAIEAIGLFHSDMSSGGYNNVGGLTIEGFDTGIRYFSAEQSNEYVPSTDVRSIQNCKTAIEVGNGSGTANIKVDCAFGMYMKKTQYMWAPMSSLRDNSCDVKFYNIAGNVLTIVGDSEDFADEGIHSLHLDLQNKSTMDGVINIYNISGCPDDWITLSLDNTSDGNIVNAFTITGSDTTSDVISKFNLITPGYSLVSGTDANHISIKVVKVTGITLNKTATTLNVGSTETLTVTVTPNNAADKSLTWTSDNEDVATVDEGGIVTAISAGTANIRATANDDSGQFAECSVTVNEP